MQTRALQILTVLVVLICGAALWFLNSGTEPPAPVAVADKPPVQVLPPVEPPRPVRPAATPVPRQLVNQSPDLAEAPVRPAPAQPMQEWELKIDQVLRANANEAQTAQMLINLLPGLPPAGQAEAAQHISNLIVDKDYAKVMPLVRNPGLPEEVLDVLVTDLMNREDDVKLPALLEIAKIPNHPHHEEAVTDLQIFLDEDFGQDWRKWDVAMKAYLKKQAAENAPEPAPANGVGRDE